MGVGDVAITQGRPSRTSGGGVGGRIGSQVPSYGGMGPMTNSGNTQGKPQQSGLAPYINQAAQNFKHSPAYTNSTPNYTPNTTQPTLEEAMQGWQTIGQGDANSPRYQAHSYQTSLNDAMMAQLGFLDANYQYGVNNAQANYGIDSSKLSLQQQLLNLARSGIGIDQNSIQNRMAGLNTDTGFLQQQRGMYDQQLANELAQIGTNQKLDTLDHQNEYIAGGGWFTPGQKFRQDSINTTADNQREAARLGTDMSKLGVDRSIAGNETQSRELGFDMERLGNKLASNGIDLQMLGLSGQQLQLGLQKYINDQGLSRLISAQDILGSASSGGSEQAGFAMQLLTEWLQGGGVGPIPFPNQLG